MYPIWQSTTYLCFMFDKPLQAKFPGRLWVCLTKDYLNDLIFEFEIDEAIQKCFDAAE